MDLAAQLVQGYSSYSSDNSSNNSSPVPELGSNKNNAECMIPSDLFSLG